MTEQELQDELFNLIDRITLDSGPLVLEYRKRLQEMFVALSGI